MPSSRCPRVIICTPEPRHGVALLAYELAVAVSGFGTPVLLCCPENFEHLDAARRAGVPVRTAVHRPVDIDKLLNRIARNLKFATSASLLQFKITRPRDVVHFHSLLLVPLGLLPLLVAKLRGARIVLTVHDPIPHRWRFPRRLRWLERVFFKAAYSLSDRLIVHNDAAKNVLITAMHQKQQRVRVIPHTAYAASPSPAYPSFGCLRLLLFGSIRQNKGVDLAIKALQMATVVAPLPVRLTIAGNAQNTAEQEYWNRCKELIGDAEAATVFEVIDRYIGEEEIAPLMSNHHAVLLPYTDFYSESGVANLSLSHARPVLATAAGGLGDLLERAECGIPIRSATADSVVDAILQACDLGPDRLRRLGTNGREFLSRERSLISIAHQTANVYRELSPALTSAG